MDKLSKDQTGEIHHNLESMNTFINQSLADKKIEVEEGKLFNNLLNQLISEKECVVLNAFIKNFNEQKKKRSTNITLTCFRHKFIDLFLKLLIIDKEKGHLQKLNNQKTRVCACFNVELFNQYWVIFAKSHNATIDSQKFSLSNPTLMEIQKGIKGLLEGNKDELKRFQLNTDECKKILLKIARSLDEKRKLAAFHRYFRISEFLTLTSIQWFEKQYNKSKIASIFNSKINKVKVNLLVQPSKANEKINIDKMRQELKNDDPPVHKIVNDVYSENNKLKEKQKEQGSENENELDEQGRIIEEQKNEHETKQKEVVLKQEMELKGLNEKIFQLEKKQEKMQSEMMEIIKQQKEKQEKMESDLMEKIKQQKEKQEKMKSDLMEKIKQQKEKQEKMQKEQDEKLEIFEERIKDLESFRDHVSFYNYNLICRKAINQAIISIVTNYIKYLQFELQKGPDSFYQYQLILKESISGLNGLKVDPSEFKAIIDVLYSLKNQTNKYIHLNEKDEVIESFCLDELFPDLHGLFKLIDPKTTVKGEEDVRDLNQHLLNMFENK